MPRYYIHTHNGISRITDEEGSELPDVATALKEALDGARQLWAAAIISQEDLSAYWIEITNEYGALILKISFLEALPKGLRP